VICWQCEKGTAQGLFCAHCGAVLPAHPDATYFDVLGERPRFALDLKDVERRFKDAARQVHPDKFAQADPRARKAALSQTVKLNEAWRTLRDEERRATYLLGLGGVKVGTEEGAAGERAALPPALLMEVLELREALAEAHARKDRAAVARLADDVRRRADNERASLARALEGWAPNDRSGAAREKAQTAANALVALRYDNRFLEEVEAHELASEGDPS